MKSKIICFFIFFIVLSAKGQWEVVTIPTPITKSEEQLKSSKALTFSKRIYTEVACVGIGTNVDISTSNYLLGVNGTIGASRIEVKAYSWSDEVFKEGYNLRTLDEVDNFIRENKHLPDIPSEEEIKAKNFDLADMDSKLLKKIEELTLYILEQDKRISLLEKELSEFKK